jgi:hypothetical protein
MKKINDIQQLQFELMKRASFNEFDGDRVVRSLEENRDLWDGVIMCRQYAEGISLRDIGDDYWSVDTVYILLRNGASDEALKKLAKTWEADEVDYLDEKEATSFLGTNTSDTRVLRVWWD